MNSISETIFPLLLILALFALSVAAVAGIGRASRSVGLRHLRDIARSIVQAF